LKTNSTKRQTMVNTERMCTEKKATPPTLQCRKTRFNT